MNTRRESQSFKLAILLFFAISLMIADAQTHWLKPVRSIIQIPLTPIQTLPTHIRNVRDWIHTLGLFQTELLEKNRLLENHNLLLLGRLQRAVSLEHENESLRQLLGVTEKIKSHKLIVAEINATSLDHFSKIVSVDLGKNDALYLNQPVVDSKGIIGQVQFIGKEQSQIILITSPKHALPVVNQRNGERGIVYGNGKNLNLKFIFSDKDIQVNDLLYSSGLGEVYPAGYPVAKIVSVKEATYGFSEIIAEPLADIDTARHVLLIWP